MSAALGAASIWPRGARAAEAGPPARGFLTAEEMVLLDQVAEVVIPADAHSPGARQAKVAADIDRRVAEMSPAIPEQVELRRVWRDGLRAVDALARGRHEVAFVAATPAQRVAILESLAAHEDNPRTSED